MIKRFILLLIISTIFTAEISNIVVQQRTDGSGIIDVTYDLIDSEGIYPSFNVSIEMNIDEAEYSTLSSSDVSGDVGENVIPGVSKSIQIQAPGDTYSDNVVVKIIASSSVVTGELPFTMISISSIEGVSSYQGETIDYNFQMMQYELTNADLVTFLETYDFELNEENNPIYDCNDYTEYFSNNNEGSDQTYGCTDGSALNYNPDAEYSQDGDCIYGWQVGCDQEGAFTYDEQVEYYDCSCYILDGNVSWVTQSHDQIQQSGSCNWLDWFENYQFMPDFYNYLSNTGISNASILTFSNLCYDGDAANYIEELDMTLDIMLNEINDLDQYDNDGNPIPIDFMQCFDYGDMEDTSSCIYPDDCDDSYFGNWSDGGDTDHGIVNIDDFSTQHISLQGASFVIESGAGEKPALFNYENCVDGVIVGLLLDYYGLRFPTGGEWTKAARQDNNRCWPWMNTNCEVANEAYCSSEYQCLSQEDFDACQDSVEQTQLDCNNQCSIDQNACNESCGCTSNSGDGDTDCNDYDGDQGGCEDNEDCTWLSDTCVDACYGCMMDEENYDNCIICEDNDCDGNPCFDGCPCCGLCDMSGGGDSCDNDCQLDCQIDQNNCNSDCNEYNNSWEYCGGQDMNDCENNYNNCSNEYSWNDCEQIWGETLEELLDGSYSGDEYGFLSTIYQNKFFNTYQSNFGEEWDNESLDLADVGQYPEGLSPFGLYDMIGNAPEMVKHENLLWLTGLTPNQSPISSFCANDNQIFDQSNYNNSHATGMSSSYGGNFNLYGLRLARTTQ